MTELASNDHACMVRVALFAGALACGTPVAAQVAYPAVATAAAPDGKGGIAPKRLPGANGMIDVNRIYFIRLDKPLK